MSWMAVDFLFFLVKENVEGESCRQRSSYDVILQFFPSEKLGGRDGSTSLSTPAQSDAHQTDTGQFCIS